MEDSCLQHQTENVHILTGWLHLNLKVLLLPESPVHMCQTWNLAEDTQLSPPHCRLCLPTLSTFCTATMNVHLQQDMEKLCKHELNGEGVGCRDAKKSFPWCYISCWAGTQSRNMVAHINGIENLILGLSSFKKLVWPVPLGQAWKPITR